MNYILIVTILLIFNVRHIYMFGGVFSTRGCLITKVVD